MGSAPRKGDSRRRSAQMGPPGSVRRVLVIDDDPVLTIALRRQLCDHEVAVATTAAEALPLLAGHRFDAILCDLHLRDSSGRHIHERRARLEPAQAARFIFLTGGVNDADLAGYLNRVANQVLTKPVRRTDLLRAIGRVALA